MSGQTFGDVVCFVVRSDVLQVAIKTLRSGALVKNPEKMVKHLSREVVP